MRQFSLIHKIYGIKNAFHRGELKQGEEFILVSRVTLGHKLYDKEVEYLSVDRVCITLPALDYCINGIYINSIHATTKYNVESEGIYDLNYGKENEILFEKDYGRVLTILHLDTEEEIKVLVRAFNNFNNIRYIEMQKYEYTVDLIPIARRVKIS